VVKRVKGGSAEIYVAKEEGDRWLSFSLRGSLERCRLLIVGLLSKEKGYVIIYSWMVQCRGIGGLTVGSAAKKN
jgi:hypothetical protein